MVIFRHSVFFFILLSAIGLLDGCSFEKELPIACVSENQTVIRKLCSNYSKKSKEIQKKNVLLDHGFKKRDVEEIGRYGTEKRANCRILVIRQCDLIVMRNGVGY